MIAADALLDLDFNGSNGTQAIARGLYEPAGDTIRLSLDSLLLRTRRQQWALAAPAAFTAGAPGFAVDSFVLNGAGGATLRLAGAVPVEGEASLRFRARELPVADLAELLAVLELDQEIPVEAFTAVAEILSYIYRANGRLGELSERPAQKE